MSSYEFSGNESGRITNWAKQMRLFGILNIILGLVIAIIPVQMLFEGGSGAAHWVGLVVRLMNAVASIALGVVLLRPIDNLKRVVNSTGSDVKEMLTALSELLGGFKIVYIVSIFYVVVLVLEFVIILAS